MTVPDLPAHAVDRPVLRRKLDEGVTRPVTLVIAPAGSGKSVLLTQWAVSRPDLRIAWVDLEPADDDPVHFLRHLIEALGIDASDARLVAARMPLGGGTSFGRPVREQLAAILGEGEPVVIVLDDVHRLTNPAVIADLEWLVDHAPADVRFVLSSRTDIARRSSRQLLHYAVVELRQHHLAFDEGTAAALLERVSGSAPSASSLATILDRTEGWAAGIQLSAIALRRRPDPEAFAAGFAGTARLVADYLSEEVLAGLPAERRELLLRMSSLAQLSAGLLDAVLGRTDGETILAELERESMFLVPLDDHGEWFRFHHLFRELLRYRLTALDPRAATETALAAAQWYVAHDDPDMAVRSLLDAEAWDAAMDLVLARGREVYERGETTTVGQWLGAVPDAVRRARPDAETLYGVLLGMSGRVAEGEDVLREIVDGGTATDGHRLIAHAFLSARVQFRGDAVVSLRTAEEAVRRLDEGAETPIPALLGLTGRPSLQAQASGALGRARFYLGDLEAARVALRTTMRTPGGQYSPYRVHLLGSLAMVEAWSGRLHAASDLAAEGLGLAREADLLLHPAPADAYLALALVHLESAEPDAAAPLIEAGSLRAAANNRTQLMWIAALERILAGHDETTWAVPSAAPPPIVADRLRAHAERARRRGAPIDTPLVPQPGAPLRGWSRAHAEHVAGLLARREVARAREAIAGLGSPTPQAEPLARVELILLHAWLALLESRRGQAAAHAKAAVALAQVHGLVDVFARVAAPLHALIADISDPPSPFAASVLESLRDAQAARREPAAQGLPDPLTDRELELLALLPSRLMNADIAGRLSVSVNTIKTHTSHIYRKLEVTTRDDAVAKARELGLI